MTVTPADNTPAGNAPGTTEPGPAGPKVAPSAATPASTGSADPTSLWKQFERDTAQKLNQVTEYVNVQMERDRAQQFDSRMEASLALCREGITNESLDKDFARGLLSNYVDTDPKAKAAWENYGTDPAPWNAYCKQVNEKLRGVQARMTGDGVRTEIDAAAAAIRNVSTSPPQLERPDPVTAMTMSDRDWAVYKAKVEAANSQR